MSNRPISVNPPNRSPIADCSDARVLNRFVLLCGLTLSVLYFAFGTYHNRPYKIEGDGKYYYQYLVSFVYDGDLDFTNNYQTPKPEWMRDEIDIYGLKSEINRRTGRPRNVWTCGPALLWAPFFGVAYVVARILDVTLHAGIGIDPWSRYYQYFVMYSAVVYCTASIWLGMRILLRHFSPSGAMSSALIIVFGTNAWYYVVFEPSYSHVYDLFTLLLYISLVFPVLGGTRRSGGGGAMAGMAAALHCLVRTQNLATVAVFSSVVAWVVLQRPARRRQARLWLGVYLLALAIGLVPIALVNHYLCGDPFGLPQGSAFLDLSRPHVFDLLFSSRNGLFYSHPILLPAAIGFVLVMLRIARTSGRDSLAYFALGIAACMQIYINSAVTDWWGGIAFGQRRLVSSYLPFAVGLAYIWERWSARSRLGGLWRPMAVLLVATSIYMAFVHVFAYRWSENRYETMFVHLPRLLLHHLRRWTG